jgi:hypothetical protein
LATCCNSGWNLANFFKKIRNLATKNSKQIANLLKKSPTKKSLPAGHRYSAACLKSPTRSVRTFTSFSLQEPTALRHFSIERPTDTRESSPVQQILATDLVTNLLIGNKANAVVIGFIFSRFSATKKAEKQESKRKKKQQTN